MNNPPTLVGHAGGAPEVNCSLDNHPAHYSLRRRGPSLSHARVQAAEIFAGGPAKVHVNPSRNLVVKFTIWRAPRTAARACFSLARWWSSRRWSSVDG